MRKKWIAVLCAVLCALSLTACLETPEQKPTEQKPAHLGLYLDDDGTLMHDGKAFYGFGVNYYSMLNTAFKNKWSVDTSLAALETLASYDVRVIRFNAAGYAPSEWDYVTKKEDRYFEAFDALADKAASLGIGLIPSFFWNQTSLSDYFDEPTAAALRTRESKTMKFIASFTQKVVARYAEHPAIYGWEYGNEVNLGMDLPNWEPSPLPSTSTRKARTKKDDKLLSTDYVNALALFAETVTEYDPYRRIIGTGDGLMRGRQYQLYKYGDWGSAADTDAENEEILDYINQSMTAVSSHAYGDGDIGVETNPAKLTSERGDFTDWDGFMTYYVAQGKRMKKLAYLGETGCGYNATTSLTRTAETSVAVCEEIAKAAVKADLQLTLYWNYDDKPDFNPNAPNNNSAAGVEWSWNERWDKGRGILEIVKKYNAAFDSKHADNRNET